MQGSGHHPRRHGPGQHERVGRGRSAPLRLTDRSGLEANSPQVFDATLDAQLLRERQRLGFDQRMATGLDRLEGIFDELSDTGISSSLRDFFNSIQDLSSDAETLSARWWCRPASR